MFKKPSILKKIFNGEIPTQAKIAIFLIFQLIFPIFTMPLFVFYGPFENVKKTLVGSSMQTLTHQFIAQTFLSDDAIGRIVGKSYADDPTVKGEEIQKINIDVQKTHSTKIEVVNIDGKTFDGKMMIIDDPTRIQIGYSSKMPVSGETTSAIAKRMNAVAAINAGGFMDIGMTGTGGAPMGFIIHDGNVVYNQIKSESEKQDTVAMTRDGMLIVGSHSISQLKSYGVKDGVSFGPPLIVNGKKTIKDDGGWGLAPRTAIGQRSDGTILMLVIDGRRFGSVGAYLRDVQDILYDFHAVNAANLDGGSSTTMYYNGNIINKPSDALGERMVPSVFVVMPVKEAGK
ncbi:MAG TPA: phosphodiester glycosidase family protein [Clostridia bacterium]